MRTFFVVLFLLSWPCSVLGITDERQIKEDVGWIEKLDSEIDLYSKIIDIKNSETNLNEVLDDTKPTVFILAYYTCPRMCTFLLNGAEEVVSSNTKIRPGVDYNLVTLSFDEADSPEIATKKQEKYAENLGEDEEWSFFVANRGSIKAITESVGFKFTRDGDEFAHPAGIIVLTKNRKVSRYLPGVLFDPKDFNLALLEASDGVIGRSSLSDRVLLYCYDFDPVGKKYALQALNVIKLGGAVTLLCLGVFLGFMWFKEKGGRNK